MPPKTSQLQIRVTPEEKDALRRMAEAEGCSISSFVLSRALASVHLVTDALVQAIHQEGVTQKGLSDLTLHLRAMTDTQLRGAPRPALLDSMPALYRNCVAACFEREAWGRGLAPPPWTGKIEPLPAPWFRWPLPSLRLHLARITPPAFKRRNVFLPDREDPSL